VPLRGSLGPEEREAIVARGRPETEIAAPRLPVRLRLREDGMDGERDDTLTPGRAGGRAARRELLHGLTCALVALAWGRSDAAALADLITCDATATSGITGVVLIGPMCPVMRADEPCPDRPFVATLLIRDSQGREMCALSSGEDGYFRIGLPPGSYELVPGRDVAGGLPSATSQWVAVGTGQYTTVTVRYDSGIR
jgi:hypothetical protein